MARFLCFHPEGHLICLPVVLRPVVLVASCLMWPLDILAWTSRLTPALTVVAIPDYVFLVLGFPGACAIVCMLQKFAWDETHALIDLKCFGIKIAVCVVEGDRATVEANVVSLTRQMERALSHCTCDGGLDTFELLVRSAMPRLTVSATKRTLFPNMYLVTVQFGLTCRAREQSTRDSSLHWIDHSTTGMSAGSLCAELVAVRTVPVA